MTRIGAFCFLAALLSTLGAGAFASDLAGSTWRPVRIGPVELDAEINLSMEFSAGGRFSANGGCNLFVGAYRETGGSAIEFWQIGVTLRSCARKMGALDNAFLVSLKEITNFVRVGNDLLLKSHDGTEMVRLVRVDLY